MAHKKEHPDHASFYSQVLLGLSIAILVAITASSFKLFRVCAIMTGEPLIASITALLFWVLGASTHLATRALGIASRSVSFVFVYGLKLVPGVLYSLTAHEQEIHSTMLQHHLSITGADVEAFASSGKAAENLSNMVMFVVSTHPPEIIVAILVTLLFFTMGDMLAIALEFVHESWNGSTLGGSDKPPDRGDHRERRLDRVVLARGVNRHRDLPAPGSKGSRAAAKAPRRRSTRKK